MPKSKVHFLHIGKTGGTAVDRWRQHAQRAMCAIQHVRESFWFWLRDPFYFATRKDDVIFVGFQETLYTNHIKVAHSHTEK